MRLLVDAQLPLRLANALTDRGQDVVHTSQLPAGNRAPDLDVSRIANTSGRILVTKDAVRDPADWRSTRSIAVRNRHRRIGGSWQPVLLPGWAVMSWPSACCWSRVWYSSHTLRW